VPVVLWTDALLFVLVAALAGYALYARRREHLRAPWRQVVRSRTAMAAAVVLATYVVIALLDSLHYHPRLPGAEGAEGAVRYATRVQSVFDHLASPLREREERTYSAPFATHLYVRQSVRRGGEVVRVHPRLEHGGAHLAEPAEDRPVDVALTSGRALLEASMVWAAAAAGLIAVIARAREESFASTLRAVARGRLPVPWRTMLVTVAVVVALAFLLARLGVKYHVLGTDKVGQDVLYLALKSVRTGLVIGTLTTLIMLPFAVLLGIMAGYFRGWVDDVIQYVYTTLNSIPAVLLIAAAILMMQVYVANHADSFESISERADLRLLFLCMILGVTSWTGLCRLLRGEVLKLSEVDYVQAATAFGVGHMTILMRHILPNVLHIVMITIVLDFSALVLAEAVLSYLNIGVDPSTISWGNMINSARLELAREPVVWWSLAAALGFMFAMVLSANLFADAVRDAFDPRLRSL